MSDEDQPEMASLEDLLRGIDKEAATSYQDGNGHYHLAPIGQYCHSAADTIAELRQRVEKLEFMVEKGLGWEDLNEGDPNTAHMPTAQYKAPAAATVSEIALENLRVWLMRRNFYVSVECLRDVMTPNPK